VLGPELGPLPVRSVTLGALGGVELAVDEERRPLLASLSVETAISATAKTAMTSAFVVEFI